MNMDFFVSGQNDTQHLKVLPLNEKPVYYITCLLVSQYHSFVVQLWHVAASVKKKKNTSVV